MLQLIELTEQKGGSTRTILVNPSHIVKASPFHDESTRIDLIDKDTVYVSEGLQVIKSLVNGETWQTLNPLPTDKPKHSGEISEDRVFPGNFKEGDIVRFCGTMQSHPDGISSNKVYWVYRCDEDHFWIFNDFGQIKAFEQTTSDWELV